jgi:hypothetical protein
VHHYRDREGLNVDAAGDRVRAMKPSLLLSFALYVPQNVVGCGGVVANTDGGSTSDANASDVTSPLGDAQPSPDAPSSDAMMVVCPPATFPNCALCSDGTYDCGGVSYDACPLTQMQDDPCDASAAVCVNCNGVSGRMMHCQSGEWNSMPTPCQ